jgi:hypothetical protein
MRVLLGLYSYLGILRIIMIADEMHAAIYRDLRPSWKFSLERCWVMILPRVSGVGLPVTWILKVIWQVPYYSVPAIYLMRLILLYLLPRYTSLRHSTPVETSSD